MAAAAPPSFCCMGIRVRTPRGMLSPRQDPQFARALSHVWISRGDVSMSTEARLLVWMDTPIIDG